MIKNTLMATLLSASLILMPSAQAHSLPVDNGTINVKGDTAYVVLSLPVQALQGVDDNGDGKLSYNEYNTHQQSIQTQIQSGFTFVNQLTDSGSSNNQSLKIISLTPAIAEDSHAHSHEPMSQSTLEQLQATHITTLASVRFATNIQQLQVNSDFFKHSAADYQFNLFAKHASDTQQSNPHREKATLSASHTTANFFVQQ